MSLKKHPIYMESHWPRWIEGVEDSRHRLVFIHGILGSELWDHGSERTVWVRSPRLRRRRWTARLGFEHLTPSGGIDANDAEIIARSTVRLPIFGKHYSAFHQKFGNGMFCFDWRDSISIEARRLKKFLQLLLEANTEPGIRIVTHSMGGLVLLRMLQETEEFDGRIRNIIFCAPPFHGALKPIRIIEHGSGMGRMDWLTNAGALMGEAASILGLFNLLPAPEGLWPTELPGNHGIPRLRYPIRTGEDLYHPPAWSNAYQMELREDILRFSEDGHQALIRGMPNVARRLADRIHVLVGLNGKTDYAATKHPEGNWVLHSHKRTPGKLANGDGTVLFQSSLIHGLPTDRYWAFMPERPADTHSDFVNLPEVANAIEDIFADRRPSRSGLVPFAEFIEQIDWSFEKDDSRNPKYWENLDYHERSLLRSLEPPKDWSRHKLNPQGDDRLFTVTRAAAFRILDGTSTIDSEAERLSKEGIDHQFLRNHLKALLLPILDG